eukprot:3890868-Rhodomonas_salina.1
MEACLSVPPVQSRTDCGAVPRRVVLHRGSRYKRALTEGCSLQKGLRYKRVSGTKGADQRAHVRSNASLVSFDCCCSLLTRVWVCAHRCSTVATVSCLPSPGARVCSYAYPPTRFSYPPTCFSYPPTPISSYSLLLSSHALFLSSYADIVPRVLCATTTMILRALYAPTPILLRASYATLLHYAILLRAPYAVYCSSLAYLWY